MVMWYFIVLKHDVALPKGNFGRLAMIKRLGAAVEEPLV